MRTIQEINADIRATRKEMRAAGIRRISCFNGGHTPESYRLNSLMFVLESELKKAKAKE